MNYLESINYIQDEEIICLTNQDGIQIYSNFKLLMKLDPFRIGLTGDVYKVKPLYNSQIIAFSIIESQKAESKEQQILYNQSKIKKHSLVLYDLKNFEIIGKITMKNFVEITDFFITKYFIIIMIEKKNKVLLFKTSNLEYFKTLSNVEKGKIAYTDDYLPKYRSPKKKSKNAQDSEKPVSHESIRHHCFLAYQETENIKNIVIMEFILNDDNM